ncbi:tetratricopeptide repeat protein [Luteimonas sp. MC1825]|uniref:tetratricopeptide repeat protein n=1 Tax=Luteimonas sp. MC1825 TaxID=2761107 RepID=UPI001611DD34|nr:tetratricopeptide repeat protein [Luteimonas sp. MC1825]MBB6600319.1 tetratricopeptide repeat protein [Luteimonas sp. MC1825]QOC87996.1 tetratricopeptide repeat protein [Luteimonas sp. MC1825]
MLDQYPDASPQMPFESIKQRITKGLMEEIGAFDPVGLEIVGHKLIELLENKRLVHHGINSDYRFSGYTVDSFDDGSTLIGQYSTTKNYFENEGAATAPIFSKIRDDIDAAKAHRTPSDSTKIYLMSTQQEQASFRSRFNLTDAHAELGDRLVILDARELAKLVYDFSVERPEAAAFFRQFFPRFDEALDQYEYYGRLPAQCENHHSNQAAIAALQDHFDSGHSIAVLHGVSGSGKTQVAVDFVLNESEGFDNYIWLAAGDWHPDTPLSAVTRMRGGRPLNVVGNFNAIKTILVIDRIDQTIDESAFAQLQPGFDKGGVVMVTSQVAATGSASHVPIPPPSAEVALLILGEDPAAPAPSSREFVNSCRSLPVVLATARSIIEAQGVARDVFYAEVLEMPDVLSGDDGYSILRRILDRLSEAPRAALEKIANTGLTMHDAGFLTHLVGNLPKLELQKLAILSPAGVPGVLLVHELVARAALTANDGGGLALEVESYVEKLGGEMIPSTLRQIHLARSALVAEHDRRGLRDPDWLLYALLQLEGVKEAVFGMCARRQINADDTLAALLCGIDAREQYAYSLTWQDRPAYYAACADEYRAALERAHGRSRSELLHHLGKAYRRCGATDQALATFNELLEVEPGWHATLGQIAHLGAQKSATEEAKRAGEEALRKLVDLVIANDASVPLRVAMAALANLRRYTGVVAELNQDESRVNALGRVLSQAALEGLDQFYDAFYAFTSKFGYNHPDLMFRLVNASGDMFQVSPAAIGKEHLGSAGEALANVAANAKRSGNEVLARRLSGSSLVYAEALLAHGIPDSYAARGIAKLFTIAGQPARALEVIGMVPVDRVDHWLRYRRAEAELALGMPQALGSAQSALAELQADPSARHVLAAYFDLVARCLVAAGDIQGAIEQSQRALAHCDEGRFERELTARLAELEAAATT